jgi:hypothetical protein
MREHPALPIVTIHDALLVPPGGEEIVAAAIRRTWADDGVEPTLKVTRPA